MTDRETVMKDYGKNMGKAVSVYPYTVYPVKQAFFRWPSAIDKTVGEWKMRYLLIYQAADDGQKKVTKPLPRTQRVPIKRQPM